MGYKGQPWDFDGDSNGYLQEQEAQARRAEENPMSAIKVLLPTVFVYDCGCREYIKPNRESEFVIDRCDGSNCSFDIPF